MDETVILNFLAFANSDNIIVEPIQTGADEVLVGLDGNEACFSNGSIERIVQLPFFDGARVQVARIDFDPLAGQDEPASINLVTPSETGNHYLTLEIQQVKGIYFAVALIKKITH